MNGDHRVKSELDKVKAEQENLKNELSEKYKDQQVIMKCVKAPAKSLMKKWSIARKK